MVTVLCAACGRDRASLRAYLLRSRGFQTSWRGKLGGGKQVSRPARALPDRFPCRCPSKMRSRVRDTIGVVATYSPSKRMPWVRFPDSVLFFFSESSRLAFFRVRVRAQLVARAWVDRARTTPEHRARPHTHKAPATLSFVVAPGRRDAHVQSGVTTRAPRTYKVAQRGTHYKQHRDVNLQTNDKARAKLPKKSG